MSEHNSDLEGQMGQRIERMDKLRARGINTFANDFVISDGFKFRSIDELPAQDAITNSDPRYDVAGRLLQVGDFGKIRFLFIRWTDGQMVQGLIRKPDDEARFELAKDLQVGDIIGFRGPQFKTKQGRPAILIEDLTLLTKAIRPLPGKVLQEEQDVNDIELLYRRRYLDFIQHPEKIDVVKKRASIIKAIRRTLDEDGFIEVETRMMLPTNGGASARPFKTKHNTLDKEFNLRIAPELDLKRLIVGGINRVYEIGRQFRNEGMDRFHNPEFTSLEFYQSYATYEDGMDMVERLFIDACRSAGVFGNPTYQGQEIEIINPGGGHGYKPFARKTMLQAVLEVLSDLPADSQYGMKLVEAFEQHVEHTLIQPTFITQHPIESSPLARKNDDDPRFVDRFELFIAGKEIANGFSELNDPVDQYNRFAEQVKQKAGGNNEAMDMDEDYIIALQYGMPPCAGVGIGIDRLVMLLTDQASIRDVILFPQMG